MKADRTEQKDLASARPEKARELEAMWNAWADRAQVKPYPGQGGGKTGKKKAADSGDGKCTAE
jgi:arylsulfatase